MPLVKLDIPAGIYNHGNELDSKGRWLDSSLVRWTNNAAQPVGGWAHFADLENLITNGDFKSSTGWTISTSDGTLTQNTTDGTITFDIGGQEGGVYGNVFRNEFSALEADTDYFVEITFSSLTTGQVLPRLNGVSGTAITASEVDGVTRVIQKINTGTLANASNTGFYVYGQSDGVVTNFRVYKEDRLYRTGHSWTNNSNSPHFAAAAYNRIVIVNGNGSVYDITPSGGVTGTPDASQNTAYGGGNYGAGEYGVESEGDYSIAEATLWSLDNWGQDLVAVSQTDGFLWELDMAAWSLAQTTEKLTKVSADSAANQVPNDNYGLVVTAERFVFALGAGGNPRKVQWCDRENLYEWQPQVTNEAGDIELQTAGTLVAGVRVRGRTLLLTSVDCWTATYQGPPTVFGFQKIGDSCGLVSKNMISSVGPSAFWMGKNNFFVYDGSQARVLPCEVHDKVFTELNHDKVSHGWCVANQKYNEVWWFYPANGATECNRYVAYDYRENHWLIGALDRSAGVDSGSFAEPWWVGDSSVYRHEVGYGYGSDDVFLESGPINFADGDQVARVSEVITEEDTQNDVSLSFKTKLYPNGTETTHNVTTLGNPTNVRFTGRQLKMRIEGGTGKNWRLGDVRLRVSPGGTR